MVQEIRVLLVEDNPGDARLIREMLIDSAHDRIQIDHVITLADALSHIAKEMYDAILLDLSLPDSHGIDTLLHMEAEAGDTAIVVLTGLDDEQLGIEAVQMGAQDYLPKGNVDGRLLVRSVRYAIERHRTEMALRRSEQEYRSLIDDVFDTSMVAVLILDGDFHVVWCNEATEIYFGIERERLLGRDKRQLIDDDLKCVFADPDDYSARLLKAYDEASFTDRFECQVLPEGDRQERWLEHWSQPIRDGIYTGGRIEQYTDITDRKMLEAAEKEQREFSDALREISSLLTSSLNLDNVLERILANLGQIIPHDSALITLIEEDHFKIAQHQAGEKRDTQEIIAEKRLQVDYKPFANQMMETQSPVIISDLQDYPEIQSVALNANIHSYIGAPVRWQNEIIGFINVLSEHVDFFNEEHAKRLSALSRLAAIALHNARSYEQSQQLAALEERQRLARDLHDSVSQTLFTCRTMSETALRRWEKDPDRAHELVQDVNQLTSTALAEMRILLLELRPTSLSDVTLRQLFDQYLRPIQDRRQFDLTMNIQDIPPLPPEVQMALYRITQEALNNIDKHAQASHVEIDVTDNVGNVTLRIQDNGYGFAIDTVATTSLGLSIMRERADKIGASLKINSQMNKGTEIEVIWYKEDLR